VGSGIITNGLRGLRGRGVEAPGALLQEAQLATYDQFEVLFRTAR